MPEPWIFRRGISEPGHPPPPGRLIHPATPVKAVGPLATARPMEVAAPIIDGADLKDIASWVLGHHERCSGSRFDPRIVEVFVAYLEREESLGRSVLPFTPEEIAGAPVAGAPAHLA